MKHTLVILFVAALAGSTAFADLVPYPSPGNNFVASKGQGFGNILVLAEAQTDGFEAVCSGPTALSNCNLLGSTVLTDLTQVKGNKSDVPINLAALGITDFSTAASQVLLIFNNDQSGGANLVTLDQLALGFYSAGGTLLWSTTPTLIDTDLGGQSGQGKAGYAYALDSTQATAAQAAITAAGGSLTTIYLGGGFTAGCDATHFSTCSFPANDGPDDLKVAQKSAVAPVPEPASILGLGTILFLLGSRLRRKMA